MEIQVGDKVCVLHNGAAVGRNPLVEGEIVAVVVMHVLESGETHVIVSRDGDTAQHSVHSSGIVILGRSRSVAEMTVAEMVERYFKVERASIVVRSALPEYDALNEERRAIFEALPKTPSRTPDDLVAKLQFAADFAKTDDDGRPWLTEFLNSLGSDYDQLMDRLDEDEMAA